MKNFIKDNRIVNDFTFAVRFFNFVKDVQVNDVCSEDEKEAMGYYAKGLLKYQCKTATCEKEIAYLRHIGVFEENIKPMFTTIDGVALEEDNDTPIYSCMTTPNVGDQMLVKRIKNKSDLERVSPKRLHYADKEKCLLYMDYNRLSVSKKDLDSIGLLDAYELYLLIDKSNNL